MRSPRSAFNSLIFVFPAEHVHVNVNFFDFLKQTKTPKIYDFFFFGYSSKKVKEMDILTNVNLKLRFHQTKQFILFVAETKKATVNEEKKNSIRRSIKYQLPKLSKDFIDTEKKKNEQPTQDKR